MKQVKDNLRKEENRREQKKNIDWKTLVLITFLILLVCAMVPIWHRWMFPNSDMDMTKPSEDLFSPINAMFGALALLGLIYTIIQQQKGLELQRYELKATREELHATAEANQTIVRDSKVTALIDLYLFFYDGNNFGKTRKKATLVLRAMIQQEAYFLFVFNRGVKAARGYEPVSEKHRIQFQKVYETDKEMDLVEFKKIDSEHRDQLDDLMHFFNLLSVRRMDEDFFQKVDFNYDKWRQLLWWYAFKSEAEFEKDEDLRKYCSLTTLSGSLKTLDKLFGFESPNSLQSVLEFAIVRDAMNRKPQNKQG